jgi:predicted Zn-dependent protease with MMP-like domain
VKVIETYPTDILDEDIRNLILEPLVKVVLDQKKPLLDVIALLKDIPQDDIISTMIAELNILRILYEGDLAEVEKKISENTGDFILTQDMLLDITTEVKRIRTDIVTL